jgi:phytoene dehydrogenase-like protein
MSARAIVLGAGADGLVAAHLLARAGLRVLVLEEGEPRDGAAEAGWIPPRIVRELALERHGFVRSLPDPWVTAPLAGGGRLELWRDRARSAQAIRRLSPHDAQRWPEFCARMARLARLLEELYCSPPPDPAGTKPGDLVRLLGLALRVRGLGRQGIEDLLRVLPMPLADLLDDWFESDALKGALAAAGLAHLRRGPRAAGTAFAFLHAHCGCPEGVFRPPLSNAARVLRALPGIEIRSGAPARIRVRAGGVTGVALAGGEEIEAPLVVSGADPRRTLLDLLEPGWLEPDLAHAVRHIRARGAAARVTLGLDRAAGFSRLVVAPSLDHLERAADAAKYGRVSPRPWIEARALEPEAGGRHRLQVHVQYAPYALAEGGWDKARRAALGEAVVRILGECEPALAGAITERHVLSPRDLEESEGWPEGQAHHAELALDQALWMRPVPALARYRTPVGGLYLCSPAMHPGAGIAGAAGYLCAQAVRRDLNESRRSLS